MLYAMEPSVDQQLVFCAGTTGKNNAGASSSMLAAITFDRNLRVIAEQVIDNPNIQACTAMKRFRGRDDLVVGGFKDMLIIRFTGAAFDVLSVVPDVHSSIIIFFNFFLDIFSDIWISSQMIYSVCRDDKYVAETTYDYTGR